MPDQKFQTVIVNHIQQIYQKALLEVPHLVIQKELQDLRQVVNSIFDGASTHAPEKAEPFSANKRRNRYDGTILSPVVDSRAPRSDHVMTKIETLTQDVNEMMRDSYLNKIWSFQDLHRKDAPPSYVHRIQKCEIKHMATLGETMIITNNDQENISVFGYDSPQILRTLDIQNRQMNCSLVTADFLIVGCRDRRIFVFGRPNMEEI